MDTNQEISRRLIDKNKTLLFALKFMDSTGFKSLLVLDSEWLFLGILSIGDIQRAIIKNLPLNTIVADILRKNPRIAHEDTPLSIIKEEMLKYRMEFFPVIDSTNHLNRVYFWDELFIEQKLPPKNQFNLPVVIMAGGVGARLKPLTNVLPKPLFPVGEHTIIEEIFCRFSKYGCNEFHISVNYKAELIEFYLKNQDHQYMLEFFREKKPMGTAGSLSLLKDKISKTFFVSNCDILIEQDYSEILDFHYFHKNEITIVAALKNYPIPYGVIDTGRNGALLSIKEKPEFTFKINSGMYILEPHLINEIPLNDFYHITQLIAKVRNRKGRLGVFPVSEGSWNDIGDWAEYNKTILKAKI
jgi:dTDP-glucose pyrophosphorylase